MAENAATRPAPYAPHLPEPPLRRLAPIAAALAVSLALHAAFFAAAAFLRTGPGAPAGEAPIAVDVLTAEQFAALNAAEPSGPPVPASPSRSPAAEPMVRPATMLSGRTLADPRSAGARALLPSLADADRMIQLCGIEAMAQIQAWRGSFRPDRVVAYASAEAGIVGDTVTAEGAAFRSGRAWYALRFYCRLAHDHAAVAAFAFRVGRAIPPRDWESQGLAADFDPEAPPE